MKRTELAAAIDAQAIERKKRLGMPRMVLPDVPSERKFATVVTGVRRCGTSTLLDQWVAQHQESTVAVHFDDLRLTSFGTGDFLVLDEIVRARGCNVVVLDEVQDVPQWERYVTGCLDLGRRVLVTGSNAKMLSREFGTKLTGRHLDLELFPFSFQEFLRFLKREASADTLDEYLSIGGFPAYVETRRQEVLVELFNDILYRDIVVRYGLRDAQPIRSLATFLLGHVGCRVSPSRLKDAIHVNSPSTVLEYFNFLEETYLVERLPQFANAPKAALLAPKKVYACDTGLVTALEPVEGANLGHKLENLVYLKLRAQGGRLSYFIGGDETECDFVREDRRCTFTAVQVAWELTPDNEAREVAGAMRAMERFGLKECVLVTRAQSDLIQTNGRLIRVVPAFEWL